MGKEPSHYEGIDFPVNKVSWKDCQKFIKKLNELTGKNFRLPTEAEWEYAARGGEKSRDFLYSGSDDLDEVAWYCANSHDQTHPVKTKRANEIGIYDMSGNVSEWCQDWYGLYHSSSVTNPQGPDTGDGRVIRGGAWRWAADDCYYFIRGWDKIKSKWCGFRLCLSE